jgi:tetratricopeptide (TPR) repeat protein
MRATMALLIVMIIAGFVGEIAFAFAPLNVSNWRYLRTAFSIASVGTGIAGAALLTGVLLGFLFGIPRTLQGDAADKTKRTYQVNTNLEQISDWLTKIIVGITLIDLRAIPEHLMTINEYLAPALGGGRRAEAMAGGNIIYFSIAGFFFGYLGTRLYLASAIPWADEDSNIEAYIAAARPALARADTKPRPPDQVDASTMRTAPEVQQLVQYTDAAQPPPSRLSPAEARTVALSYYLSGEYEKAVPFFDRANTNIADDPTFTMKHAIALAESGLRDRLVSMLEDLASRGLGEPDVHELLGYYLLWYPSRLQDSVSHTKRYLEKRGDDAAALLNLACAYSDLADQAAGRNDTQEATSLRQQALDELRKAVAIDPTWGENAATLRDRGEHFSHISDTEFQAVVRGTA